MLNLVILGQTVKAYMCGDLLEKWDSYNPPFKVIQGSSWATYITQLPTTSYQWSIVTMGLSRTVSEINGDYDWKSPFIFQPHLGVQCPHWVGFPLVFCNGGGAQRKLEWCPYQTIEKLWWYVHSFKTQYWHWTDRQTDGRNW